MKNIYTKLVKGIKGYFSKEGFSKAVVGLSGGIDSAVCLKLAVDALSSKNVFAVLMPELGLTDKNNINDAKELAKSYKVAYFIEPINNFIKQYQKLSWSQNLLAVMNTKARIRATILYNFANTHSALVVGTSNKSELMVGYGTKYGDLASDILVLGDLYKTGVIELAKYLKVPDAIIRKIPSAELKRGQSDETDLGISYKELDEVLRLIEKRFSTQSIAKKGFNAKKVDEIKKRIRANEHKRKTPYIVNTNKVM